MNGHRTKRHYSLWHKHLDMTTGCPIAKPHSDVTYVCDPIYVHILHTLSLHLRWRSLGECTRDFVESRNQISLLFGRYIVSVHTVFSFYSLRYLLSYRNLWTLGAICAELFGTLRICSSAQGSNHISSKTSFVCSLMKVPVLSNE